jgi:hypothetical protein
VVTTLHESPHPFQVNRGAVVSNFHPGPNDIDERDVGVYIQKQALGIGDENEKIAKCEWVSLQPHDGVSERQDAGVYRGTSVWVSESIILDAALC